jgi:hypothetical protein
MKISTLIVLFIIKDSFDLFDKSEREFERKYEIIKKVVMSHYIVMIEKCLHSPPPSLNLEAVSYHEIVTCTESSVTLQVSVVSVPIFTSLSVTVTPVRLRSKIFRNNAVDGSCQTFKALIVFQLKTEQ